MNAKLKKTKAELVENIYESTNIEKKEIAVIVDEFLLQLKNGLAHGETIELRGFGTVLPRFRKGRAVARNPKNGEKASMKAHYTAVFRAGKDLKEEMLKLEVGEEK